MDHGQARPRKRRRLSDARASGEAAGQGVSSVSSQASTAVTTSCRSLYSEISATSTRLSDASAEPCSTAVSFATTVSLAMSEKVRSTVRRSSLYTLLPLRKPESTRLLRLMPASSRHEDLYGEIFVVDLDEPVDFEALSYTWAEPFEGQSLPKGSINIADYDISTTGNLDHALRRLRLQDRPRNLWIDALCINQENDLERGYQIEIMEHIYSRAKCVVVWLGEDSADLDGQYIFNFESVIQRCRTTRPRRSDVDRYASKWPECKRLAALFANRRYWTRRWIVQEICHARDVELMCGDNSTSLSLFKRCVDNIANSSRASSRRALSKLDTLCKTFEQKREALGAWRDAHPSSSEQYHKARSDDRRIHHLSKLQMLAVSDFISMLQDFHEFGCSDDRDRIFALISLWKDDAAVPSLKASNDYEKPCDELYIDFAAQVVNSYLPDTAVLSRLLSIAAHQACNYDRSTSNLPSWVVDWRLDPAPLIGPDEIFGKLVLTKPLKSPHHTLYLNTRVYGQISEATGHYRDWILQTADGSKKPTHNGPMSDEHYVAALGRLCPHLQDGDLLCQPCSSYRARHGHVGDAAIVLRPSSKTDGSFQIIGRCPLDLFWREAEGGARKTSLIPTERGHSLGSYGGKLEAFFVHTPHQWKDRQFPARGNNPTTYICQLEADTAGTNLVESCYRVYASVMVSGKELPNGYPGEIILFNFPESVYGRRMVRYLHLRGLPFSQIRVPPNLPRPILHERLGVKYRRIPIMSIGRDIYIDTRLMISKLETFFPDGRLGAQNSFHAGFEDMLEEFIIDGGPFWKTAGCIPVTAPLAQDAVWMKDRYDGSGGAFNKDALVENRAWSISQVRLHFSILEKMLADGRDWILGTSKPGLAEVHAGWVYDWAMDLAGAVRAEDGADDQTLDLRRVLNARDYPKVHAWVKRLGTATEEAARLNTAKGPIDEGREAEDRIVKKILGAALTEPSDLQFDQDDALGFTKGQRVSVAPTDFGATHKDEGPLVGLTENEAVVEIDVPNGGGNLRVHYPRINFRILPLK